MTLMIEGTLFIGPLVLAVLEYMRESFHEIFEFLITRIIEHLIRQTELMETRQDRETAYSEALDEDDSLIFFIESVKTNMQKLKEDSEESYSSKGKFARFVGKIPGLNKLVSRQAYYHSTLKNLSSEIANKLIVHYKKTIKKNIKQRLYHFFQDFKNSESRYGFLSFLVINLNYG